MTAGLSRSVPSLLVPTQPGVMVLPSAMVCEVQAGSGILSVPGTRAWVLGYVMWRDMPVSVVSYDRLVGGTCTVADIRKLVILYPLPGRPRHDFFAFATHAEPRTSFIDSGFEPESGPQGLPRQHIAAFLKMPQGLGIIPDFQALKSAFYGRDSRNKEPTENWIAGIADPLSR